MKGVLSFGAVLGGVWLLVTGFAPVQGPPAKLSIVYPTADSLVMDEVVIRVTVFPSTVKVTRMSFFADAKRLCILDSPPFECAWNAGPQVTEHSLRVAAQLADGRLLEEAVRTKGGYVEKVNVDIIQVTASVTDEQGNYVRGLKLEDFRLFEDDALQKIQTCESEKIPLEINVAVDMSGSMIDAMPQVRRSVKQFLQALRPQDRVWLMAFNNTPVILARPTADMAARLRAVDRLTGWGGTALYDVIAKSMDTLDTKTGRRALVVFSDGEDTVSHIRREAAEKRVQQSDAVIYTVGQGRGTRNAEFKRILDGLARVSGGRAFFTESPDKLDEAFAQIIEELANQYLIGYEPPRPEWNNTWRRITLRTTDGRYKVKARQGYLR